MNRRNFLKQCALATGSMALAGSVFGDTSILKNNSVKVSKGSKKPNILFIYADDQCHETIRSMGCDEISTPNLDRLVRNGVTFTHAYNMGSWTGAICIASRKMVNTGRFVWKAETLNWDAELEAGRLWSPLMKQAGYDAYFAGKWHGDLSVLADPRTFDHIHRFKVSHCNEQYNRPRVPDDPYAHPDGDNLPRWEPWDTSKPGHWLWDAETSSYKHMSVILADDAEEYLNMAAQSSNPFFMYMAFNASHDPRQSPREYVEKYPWQDIEVPGNFLPNYPYDEEIGCSPDPSTGLRDERLAPTPRTEYAVKVHRQEYYALITHMDHQIGRILDALEKTGQADNTYIFYTADNGLSVGQHGLMGKQNMYECSMGIPLIVCGPGIPKNRKIDARVYLQDIMPSTLELAGVEIPSYVQFKSLMPLIQGKASKNYDAIYGGYRNLQRMVIDGDYKLILYPQVPAPTGPVKRLFNLADDPHEMNDLASDPTKLQIMKNLYATLRQLQPDTGDGLDLTLYYPELL